MPCASSAHLSGKHTSSLTHTHSLSVCTTISAAPATSLIIPSLLLRLFIPLPQRTLRMQLEPTEFPPRVAGCLTGKVPCSPGQEPRLGPLSLGRTVLGAAHASPSHRLLQKPDAGKGAIKFSKRHFPGELLMCHVVSEKRKRLQAALWHSFSPPAPALPGQNSESPAAADSCLGGKQISSHLGGVCARRVRIN